MSEAPRLLLDEMLSGQIVAQLQARGQDVLAVVTDPDLVSASDEEVLAFATAQGRCLVTANLRDFVALAAAWSSRGRSHAGLIYVVTRVFPQDRSFIGAIVTCSRA